MQGAGEKNMTKTEKNSLFAFFLHLSTSLILDRMPRNRWFNFVSWRKKRIERKTKTRGCTKMAKSATITLSSAFIHVLATTNYPPHFETQNIIIKKIHIFYFLFITNNHHK